MSEYSPTGPELLNACLMIDLPMLPRGELLSTPINSVSALQGRRYFPSVDGIYDITIPDAPELVAPVMLATHPLLRFVRLQVY